MNPIPSRDPTIERPVRGAFTGTATAEDVRRFQFYQCEHGVGDTRAQRHDVGAALLFRVVLDRPDLSRRLMLTLRRRNLPDGLSMFIDPGSAGQHWASIGTDPQLPGGKSMSIGA